MIKGKRHVKSIIDTVDPLAMLTKILKSPSLVDRYYNLFKKSI